MYLLSVTLNSTSFVSNWTAFGRSRAFDCQHDCIIPYLQGDQRSIIWKRFPCTNFTLDYSSLCCSFSSYTHVSIGSRKKHESSSEQSHSKKLKEWTKIIDVTHNWSGQLYGCGSLSPICSLPSNWSDGRSGKGGASHDNSSHINTPSDHWKHIYLIYHLIFCQSLSMKNRENICLFK